MLVHEVGGVRKAYASRNWQGSLVYRCQKQLLNELSDKSCTRRNGLDQKAFGVLVENRYNVLPSSSLTLCSTTVNFYKLSETERRGTLAGLWGVCRFGLFLRVVSASGHMTGVTRHTFIPRDSFAVRRPTRHSSALNQTAPSTFFPRSRSH